MELALQRAHAAAGHGCRRAPIGHCGDIPLRCSQRGSR
jgi:hypothetical protein